MAPGDAVECCPGDVDYLLSGGSGIDRGQAGGQRQSLLDMTLTAGGQCPTWLFSTLLVAVVLGGMQTTRHGLLQLTAVLFCGIWCKVCVLSPRPCAVALLRRAGRLMPRSARRLVRRSAVCGLTVLLGQRAALLVCGGAGVAKRGNRAVLTVRSSQRHSLRHGRGRQLSNTVKLFRKMPWKTISRLWGRFNQLDLPVHLRRPLLSTYVWMFDCRLEEAEVEDLSRYRNLGEFFRRQLKSNVRPVDRGHALTSPADGRVLFCGRVEDGILEQIKGVTYSLRAFLGEQTWRPLDGPFPAASNHRSDKQYQLELSLKPDHNLFHCIIYLAPGDYHRFHSPANWTIEHRRHFPGELLSVCPKMVRWIQGLFTFNERVVYTGSWQHGFFSMTAVGATNVGSIQVYCDQELQTNTNSPYRSDVHFDKIFNDPICIEKGAMLGEFNLGSTIVLIFEAPNTFQFKLHQGQRIRFGEPVGRMP